MKNQKAHLVKKSGTYNYNIIIPKEVERKIRFICKKSWETEWSGVLFFEYNGTFEDNDLNIICKDILVLDVGSSTYTEFNMSPKVISYMTENPLLLDCQMALVHSHNNMATFFSTTDQDTLLEEGLDRNNFVSLIVNNKGEYTAAITRKVKIKKVHTSYNFFDKGEQENTEETIDEETVVEWFNLNVIIEGEEDFSNIENELKAIKESKVTINSFNGTFKTPLSNPKNIINTKLPEKVYSTNGFLRDAGIKGTLVEGDIEDFEYLEDIEYNEDLTRSIVLQLITGSIIISNTTKLDVNKWVNSMPSLYKSRFGNDMELFKDWAMQFIEYLISTSLDKDLAQELDNTELAYICANSVQKELKKLNRNPYINTYIDILETYKEI